MRCRVARVEDNGSLIFPFRNHEIIVIVHGGPCQRRMCLCEVKIHVERFLCQPLPFATTLIRGDKTKPASTTGTVSQTGIGSRIAWVLFYRLLEAILTFSEGVSAALVPVVAALQIGFVGFRFDGVHLRQLCLLLGG